MGFEDETDKKRTVGKEVLTKVGYIVKEYSKVVLPALGYAIFSQRGKLVGLLEELQYSGNVTYNDAVRVIMDSDMLTSYKTDIVKILKRNETSDYYKAVIHTVKSDILSIYKVDIIEELNAKEDRA